jgi:hypothetical protein
MIESQTPLLDCHYSYYQHHIDTIVIILKKTHKTEKNTNIMNEQLAINNETNEKILP